MIIKLGIIGFGGMGKWHAQNAPRADVEIAAVCDIAEEKQKEAIEMGYRLYTNADELLADPEVNTVILTVPNYLHKEMCIKAAKAGKNVITEKPAAMSVQELDEMEAACKEAGVFFTSHQNRRWDKDMLTKMGIEMRAYFDLMKRIAVAYNNSEAGSPIRKEMRRKFLAMYDHITDQGVAYGSCGKKENCSKRSVRCVGMPSPTKYILSRKATESTWILSIHKPPGVSQAF